MSGDVRFSYILSSKQDATLVSFHGPIDEDTDFSSISFLKGPLIFNFKNVNSVNSCGVRSWLNYLKELGTREIRFEECSPSIVRQLNMIPSFHKLVKVDSVFVPFVCSTCETEKLVLISQNQFSKSLKTLNKPISCDGCKEGKMEFDGDINHYFAFVNP